MIHIKKFIFNPFQVNTYVLYDETGEAVIIDAACSNSNEEKAISRFIEENNLKPVMLLSTHTHIDHILGNPFIADQYGLELMAHADSEVYLDRAPDYAAGYGLPLSRVEPVKKYLTDGQILGFGTSSLKVLHTPGHAVGSVCFYSEDHGFVVVGDVLFHQSIGRTDLPGGDYDVLKNSIWSKLFVLNDSTVVLPGHGPETTIGNEKVSNPFVAIG
jgi:glyoxylase-like metal-dependent hydrolase (beta-lactamase superfamily II)